MRMELVSGRMDASTDALRNRLLHWYDANARALPWRIGPAERARGIRPDPYRVWLSEVMLQQTTVPHATGYFLEFTRRWPTVGALAAAPDAEVMAAWAGLGYYARARNLIACARAVASAHGGRFPQTEEGLRGLPGIGAYTAAAVAAIAFDEPANVVDGNVERVIARLNALEAPLPAAKPELKALAARTEPVKLIKGRGGQPGTLEIKVDGPSAALIQHQAPEILARVKLFLGEGAVDRLRIVQGPIRPRPSQAQEGAAAATKRRRNTGPLDAAIEAQLEAELSCAPDGPLKAALLRLGREVRRARG